MPMLDIPWVRSQFPALDLEVNGTPAVFLDGPGGTQVPNRVIESIGAHARTNALLAAYVLATGRWDLW